MLFIKHQLLLWQSGYYSIVSVYRQMSKAGDSSPVRYNGLSHYLSLGTDIQSQLHHPDPWVIVIICNWLRESEIKLKYIDSFTEKNNTFFTIWYRENHRPCFMTKYNNFIMSDVQVDQNWTLPDILDLHSFLCQK